MGVLDSSRKLKLWFKHNATLRKTLPSAARKEAFEDLNSIRHPYKGLSTTEAKRRFKRGLMAGKWLRPGDPITDKQAYRIQNELEKEWKKEASSPRPTESAGTARTQLADLRARHAREARSAPPASRPSLLSRFSSGAGSASQNQPRLDSPASRPSPVSRFKSNPRPGSVSSGRKS